MSLLLALTTGEPPVTPPLLTRTLMGVGLQLAGISLALEIMANIIKLGVES